MAKRDVPHYINFYTEAAAKTALQKDHYDALGIESELSRVFPLTLRELKASPRSQPLTVTEVEAAVLHHHAYKHLTSSLAANADGGLTVFREIDEKRWKQMGRLLAARTGLHCASE
jgi:hypothetical protein